MMDDGFFNELVYLLDEEMEENDHLPEEDEKKGMD